MNNFNPQFEKIGDILINEGLIDQNQLSDALEEQKIKKDKIGRILLSKGYINDNELIRAYSLQSGFKEISEDEILGSDMDAVSMLSEDFARENLIIAVSKTDSSITIVMEDPENLEVVDSVQKITNLK